MFIMVLNKTKKMFIQVLCNIKYFFFDEYQSYFYQLKVDYATEI